MGNTHSTTVQITVTQHFKVYVHTQQGETMEREDHKISLFPTHIFLFQNTMTSSNKYSIPFYYGGQYIYLFTKQGRKMFSADSLYIGSLSRDYQQHLRTETMKNQTQAIRKLLHLKIKSSHGSQKIVAPRSNGRKKLQTGKWHHLGIFGI